VTAKHFLASLYIYGHKDEVRSPEPRFSYLGVLFHSILFGEEVEITEELLMSLRPYNVGNMEGGAQRDSSIYSGTSAKVTEDVSVYNREPGESLKTRPPAMSVLTNPISSVNVEKSTTLNRLISPMNCS